MDGVPLPISVRGGSLLGAGVVNQAWTANDVDALAQMTSTGTIPRVAFTLLIWFLASDVSVSNRLDQDMRLVSIYNGATDLDKQPQAYDFQVGAG